MAFPKLYWCLGWKTYFYQVSTTVRKFVLQLEWIFLVLLAIPVANYTFICVDVGEYGSNVGSNVFLYSKCMD